MKLFFTCIFLLTAVFSVFAEDPLFIRELSVGGDSKEKLTTKLEFFLPDSCSGYRLYGRHSKEHGVQEYYRRGSRVKIFFSAGSGQKFQLVFYKNKVKRLQQKQTSGVLRRVKEFDGRNVKSLAQFKNLWENAELCGAEFEKNIYSGWNPFGPKKNSLHWYSAFIDIPRDGKWTFFSASTDASFLLVDDKLVVDSPYRKWVYSGQCGNYKGEIELKKGVHRLDYLHANNNPNYCYAIAGFLPPGARQKRLFVIPEKLFTPVLTAETEPLRTPGYRLACDFSWHLLDMVEINGKQMYVVSFATHFKKFLKWSLGPDIPEFNYFYFKPGKYPIELKCRAGRLKQEVVIDYQYMLKPIGNDKVREFIKEALKQERSSGIQVEGYAFLVDALIKLRMKVEAEKFYRVLLTKQNIVSPGIVFTLFNDLVFDELLSKEKYKEAEKQLKVMLKLLKSPKLLAAANLKYAGLLFYYLGDNTGTEKLFAKVGREDLTNDLLRMRYDILRADMAMLEKGPDAAAELYKKIKGVSTLPSQNPQLAVSGGMLAVRNCCVLKKYDAAWEHSVELEDAYPAVRLDPEYLLLKAKILEELKQPRRAANVLLRLLQADPPPALEAEANRQLAQFYFADGQYLLAQKRLNIILKNAPRSKAAAEAAELLKKVDKELRK
jgi:tetratricopeptide (TPR) repeat protein